MDIADPEVEQQPRTDSPVFVGSDRYRIQSTLGAGGMGIVYLAEDLKLHRQVAIKKLKDNTASQNARDRIQQEARLLAQLNHPNIVALHDVLEDQGDIALVMEYIEGTTLRPWMRERSPSLQQKLSLLMQICQGLSEAHNLGIIHRDLKSDNILIAENAKGEPVAKITDFGIAKSQQLDEKTLTAENQLAGTITAMSPEQILGKPLDARSDLFSFGTIAFELLCGSRPFEKHEAGALAMANRITNEAHTPPQEAWPDIPEPLAILLDKLLAKDPAQRPQNALVVYQGFALLHKQGLESESEDFTATMTDLFTHHKIKNRRRWQRVVAGMAVTLIVSAGGYWGWKEFTRLEPQYIAVMPVEINGEIRGEENAKALTRTMVRQALMNSVSQLKASALVSFTPKEGQDFEAQLQKLKDKGVTDALYAKLVCAQVRCEIELQRLAPINSQIKKKENFTFLTDKLQEAHYRTSNSTALLFPSTYQKEKLELTVMSDRDYSLYLDILSRMEAKKLNQTDLAKLISMSSRYPQNIYIYNGLSNVAARLFILDGNSTHLEIALDALNQGEKLGVEIKTLNSLKLFIYGLGGYSKQFQNLIAKVDNTDFPVAEILSERARNSYRNGKYESALDFAKQASALNPSADNLYLIALSNAISGNYHLAHAALKKLIDKYPDHWSSYSALANIEMEIGDLDSAEKTITSIPEELRGWRTKSNLGVIYFLQKKYSKALESYSKVLELVPTNIPTIGNLAETYLMLDNNDKAQENFNQLLTITQGRDDLESRLYQAIALAYLGKASDSISLIHTLVRESPDDVDVNYNAAQIYALAGEWSSANHYMEQLLKQGMGPEWFSLPAFQKLCAQPQVSIKVKSSICD
ncbi:serine/threonine-protein kinase [Microbulbifer mangrovi]|uniref:serine/threonine-protein kinase n=1 Tax=Microbulbifer mangrovi TaxID=927787 RepID=UPI0009905685|nr:serine/threonine-protein kinase [Microbulbifer mangrovi]